MLTKLANMSTKQKIFSIILIVVILLKIFYGVTFKTGQKIIAAQSKIEKVEGKQVTQKANEKVDWHDPSENKPYPNISDYPNFWIHVSIEKHRVYLIIKRYCIQCCVRLELLDKRRHVEHLVFKQNEENIFIIVSQEKGLTTGYHLKIMAYIYSIRFLLTLMAIMLCQKQNSWERLAIRMAVSVYQLRMLNGFTKMYQLEQKS